jgi:hypothetical protein
VNWEKIIILLFFILVAFTANVSAQTQVTTQSVAVDSEKANSDSSNELKLALMEKELQVCAERLREVLARE